MTQNVWLGILYLSMNSVGIYRENVIIMISGSVMSGKCNLSYRGFWGEVEGAGRGRTTITKTMF